MSDPRPTVGPLTERVYASLPDLYRDADAAQDTGPNNYPLLRYLSLLLDQLTPVEVLRARFSYTPLDERGELAGGNPFGLPDPWQRFGTGLIGDDTYGDGDRSDLVDPGYADAGWLPWLGQLLGIAVTGLTVEQQRDQLARPADQWAHGTPGAITRAARRELAATAYVDTIAHYQGDPFTIAVVTRNDETYGATTWGELEALAPTWGDLKALGDYSNAEAAQVMHTAGLERPAGYRLTHVYLEDL